MRLLKQKAIFMLFVIVFSAFYFPFNAPQVEAQENKECCEKTVSGDFCVYTSASQCDKTKQHSLTTCENTDYCSLGCCFDSDSGECFNNVANSECKSQDERTFQQGECSQIPQCSIGCCQLSNQAFISTLTKCKSVTSQYPDVTMKFDPGIQDEYICLASVRSGVKGCCVKAQGQCSFTTAEECGIQKTLPPPPEQQVPGFENCISEGSVIDSSKGEQCCQGLESVQIGPDPNAKPVCRRSAATDTFPPQITIQSPLGTVTQLSTTLQISTNKAANCRYDTQDKSFDQMSSLFSTTGGTSHSVFISNLINGNSYNYYVRCKDPQNNIENPSSTVITFNVNTQSITGQAVLNFDPNTPPEEKTGFFEGYLCSNDELPCDVAKLHNLGCYNEDVYWFDSGNNPENVFLGNSETQKEKSYNKGRILENIDNICTNPDDENCGNCDYTLGTLCGEKDGEFLCKDLNCKDTTSDPNSPDATGGSKALGQSWCLYDGPVGPDAMGAPQDRVGSRHFRAACINGEELTEPCKDFREELCTQSYSNGVSTTGEGTSLFFEVTKNLPQLPFCSSPLSNVFNPSIFGQRDALGLSGSGGYSEAACRQNRFDSCAQCNTLSSQSKVRSCCEDISQRDCSFLQSGVTAKGGTCVPLVKPGSRFWQGNTLISSRQSTTNNPSPTGKAITEITGEQVTNPTNQPTNQPSSGFFGTPQPTPQPTGSPADTPQIRGNQNLNLGSTGVPTNTQGVNVNQNIGNDICSQANVDCEIGFTRTGWDHILGKSKWEVTYNPQCLTDDAFTAAHSVCRSIGDCGAYFNYVGVFTEGGFDVKAEGPKGELAIPDNIREKLMARARPNLLKYALEKPPQTGGSPKAPTIGTFFKKSAIPLSIIGVTVLGGLASGGLGAAGGALLLGPMTLVAPFAGIGGGSTGASMATSLKGAGFGSSTFVNTLSANQAIPAGTFISTEKAASMGFIKEGGLLTKGGPIPGLTPAEGGFTVAEGSTLKVPQGQSLSLGTATPAGYALGVANLIAWVWTIYELVDWLAADTKKGKVGFICKAWEAPDGGNDCDKCNKNLEVKPCSEYRCKSLGKLCELVNKGTDNEICTNVQPNDAFSPRIRPDKDYMKDYQIQEVSNEGFEVTNSIPPFTPVKLGLITDEAAQCKFNTKPSGSLQSKEAFDSMEFDFGSSLFLIKHNMTFMLPSELTTQQALQLTNNGQYTIYVRCKDSTGNANGRDYYIKFSIEPGPDLSAPEITSVNPLSGTYVKEEFTELPIKMFVNELATCKWEVNRDIDYDAMQNQFSCESIGTGLVPTASSAAYECSTTLKLEKAQGLPAQEATSSSDITPTPGNIRNVYYFRCKDKENNKNTQGYPYTLISSTKLEIVNKSPSGELETGNNLVLSVTTSKGAESGRAICGYSDKQNVELPNMPAFVNTLSNTHTQPLSPLNEGTYRFYVVCQDKAGNVAIDTTTTENSKKGLIEFTIKADRDYPKLVSVYKEAGTLHITTDEPSSCQYSDSDFNFGSGSDMSNPISESHDAALINQIYIIKCNDEFGITSPGYIIYP
ncbi:PT domain-containing protein [Candidatus Woesearchaeota archaeon]|nr:PT domain-containing protein [Candidatus Woesearchaeota archaeon]